MAQASPMLKSSAKKIPSTPEAAWSRARSGMPWNFVAPAREVGLRLAAEGPSDYLCLLGPRRAERTQFRGPNAAGIAEGHPLPVSWSNSDTQTVLWRAAVPGLGHSSPIIWADRVFAATAAGNPEEHH